MNPDVLIYISKVKKYLNDNLDAYNYFLNGVDENFFYELLTEMSEKNYEEFGDPILTQEQFETLRVGSRIINDAKNLDSNNEDLKNEIYLTINGFGKICLN